MKKSLKFHIRSNDYFGTLATIISLNKEANTPIPNSVIDDLMFLQKNYKIVEKKHINNKYGE